MTGNSAGDAKNGEGGDTGKVRVPAAEAALHLKVWFHKYDTVGRGLVAFRWLDEEGRRAESRRWMDFMLPFLFDEFHPARSKAVLDVGCGFGRWYGLLSEMFGTYTGVDILEPLISEAQETFPEGDFRLVTPSDPFPVPDSSQDVVWFVTMLQHITLGSLLGFILEECGRVLKPGGKIFALENTHAKKGNIEIIYRPVSEYLRMFSKMGTARMLGRLNAHGEDHTAFIVEV